MRRFVFLIMCFGLLLVACDKEAEVNSSADANADLNGSATASSNESPPENKGFDPHDTDQPSANAPGLYCWTPAGMIDVQPGDTLVMVPGAGCDPHPSTKNLRVTEGKGPFQVQEFAPGARIIFQPSDKADGDSCDPAKVSADLGYGEATIGLAFQVVRDGCEGS